RGTFLRANPLRGDKCACGGRTNRGAAEGIIENRYTRRRADEHLTRRGTRDTFGRGDVCAVVVGEIRLPEYTVRRRVGCGQWTVVLHDTAGAGGHPKATHSVAPQPIST